MRDGFARLADRVRAHGRRRRGGRLGVAGSVSTTQSSGASGSTAPANTATVNTVAVGIDRVHIGARPDAYALTRSPTFKPRARFVDRDVEHANAMRVSVWRRVAVSVLGVGIAETTAAAAPPRPRADVQRVPRVLPADAALTQSAYGPPTEPGHFVPIAAGASPEEMLLKKG